MTASAVAEPGAGRRRLLLLLLVVLALSVGLSYGLCIQDDTWISFRYADNLAHGHGLVYNPGQRVEGYTNFLWTVVIAGVMALGLDPVLPTVLLSLVSGACLVLLAAALVRPRAGLAGVVVAAGLVATDTAMALEAVQGLESCFFAALVGAALVSRIAEEEHSGRLPLSALWCGLAALTRPEGILVFAMIEGLAWLPSLRSPAGPLAALRRRLPAVAVFGLIAGAHLVFRLAYYGSPVPNTFHAKVGWSSAQLVRGVEYLGAFAAAHVVLLAFALAGAAVLLLRQRQAVRTVLMVGLPLGYLSYVVVVGGDFKPTWRFVLPVLVPLAVLAQEGAMAVGRRLGRPLPVAVAVLLVAVGVDQLRLYPTMADNAAERRQDLEDGRLMGTWLRTHVPPDTVLAIHAAGIVPFHSKLPTIDMWGLSDPHIARRRVQDMGTGLAGHEKTDYAYVFGQEPDIYVPHHGYVSAAPLQLQVPQDFPPDFEQHYEQFSIRVEGGRVLNLYARSGQRLPWDR